MLNQNNPITKRENVMLITYQELEKVPSIFNKPNFITAFFNKLLNRETPTVSSIILSIQSNVGGWMPPSLLLTQPLVFYLDNGYEEFDDLLNDLVKFNMNKKSLTKEFHHDYFLDGGAGESCPILCVKELIKLEKTENGKIVVSMAYSNYDGEISLLYKLQTIALFKLGFIENVLSSLKADHVSQAILISINCIEHSESNKKFSDLMLKSEPIKRELYKGFNIELDAIEFNDPDSFRVFVLNTSITVG